VALEVLAQLACGCLGVALRLRRRRRGDFQSDPRSVKAEMAQLDAQLRNARDSAVATARLRLFATRR